MIIKYNQSPVKGIDQSWLEYWVDYYYTDMDTKLLQDNWFNWQLVPQNNPYGYDYYKIINFATGETLANNVVTPKDWADGCQALIALRHFLTNINDFMIA